MSNVQVDIKTSNTMSISRCCFAEDGNSLQNHKTARANWTRLYFLIQPIKFLIRGAVVAGPVVEAKAPPRQLLQMTKTDNNDYDKMATKNEITTT